MSRFFRNKIWIHFLSALCVVLLLSAKAEAQFGTVPIGSSVSLDVAITASTGGTVDRVQAVTQGVTGLDYAIPAAPATSCSGITVAPNGSCNQSIQFTPTYPGQRIGAVELFSGSTLLGVKLLSGTGLGGLGAFVPGNIVPVAGSGAWTQILDGVDATLADLNLPSSLVLDGSGNMYIADSVHNLIRKVSVPVSPSTAHIISTYAGNGDASYAGDGGLAVSAKLSTPSGITIDGAGNLYIADSGNNRIRRIDALTGIITTFAGTGTIGTASAVGDGTLATTAYLNSPQGVTLDAVGNLYIADTGHHRIRKVDSSTGIISTVAGSGTTNNNGSGGYDQDGIPAVSAQLNSPYTVAFDASGNMYIPDSANNRIRKVSIASGLISTFAGTGTSGHSGDGHAAASATLWSPSAVAIDPAGNLYIADTQNNSIRKVSVTTGNISTLAISGTGEYLYSGALSTISIYGPMGLYLDGAGNLYFADYFNMRIRKIESNLVALDYTANAVRQGDRSITINQVIENIGNAVMDLTTIAPGTNTAVDSGTTTCVPGTLAIGSDCLVGAIFAPESAGNPLSGTIDVSTSSVSGSGIVSPNSPLEVAVVGYATAVNSTTVAVRSSDTPSVFGNAVTFTATVTTGASSGNLSGSVTFLDGTDVLAANVPLSAAATTATAIFSTAGLSVGHHSVTASYSGDTLHFSSTSTAITQVINEATQTVLVSSKNPSDVGDNVTFTATVTPSAGGGVTPDGTITFSDGSSTLITENLNASGIATYSTSILTYGVHTITATYNGDSTNYLLSSSPVSLVQDVQSTSSVSISSSLNPSNYGSAVTFTVVVVPANSQAATGNVAIYDGSQQIGLVALVGTTNSTTFSTSSLGVGTHSIGAIYLGDNYYKSSTTASPLAQLVNVAQTSTTVTASKTPGIAGATMSLSATVRITDGGGTPTGIVTFLDGTTTLGKADLNASGAATLNVSFSTGTHPIVASYSGDTHDNGSTSSSLSLPVIQATTATSLTSSANPATVLSSITFTAKLSGNGGTPTGTVNFLANGSSIGTGTLDATGTAAISYANLAAGSYSITASYSGDTNDLASTSPTLSQTVVTITTTTALGTATTAGATPETILVATVIGASGPVPTGAVTFSYGSTIIGTATLDSTGVATLIPNLHSGTYSVVAKYSGDLIHSASTSTPLSLSNVSAGFSIAATPSSVTIASGQNTTLTITLTSNNDFSDTIGLGCSSLPAVVTCHFASINSSLPSNSAKTVQLTIDTNNPLSGGTTASNRANNTSRVALAGVLLPFSIFLGGISWQWRRRNGSIWTLSPLLFAILFFTAGCGSFSQRSAAPGTYVIQVTGVGANSNISHYENVTLNITK